VRWLVLPYLSQGWAAAKAMNRTVGFLFRRLEEATGISALSEISDFFSAMSGMFDAFSSRTQTIHDILRAASTAFVLVTGPEEQVLTEAEFFTQKMRALHMPLKGVVFNRVHAEFPADPALFPAETVTRADEPVVAAQLAAANVPAAHVPWLTSNFVDYQLLARGEALRMEQFRHGLPRRAPFVTVPNFDSDLHDLTGLARMHRYLFETADRATGAAPEQLLAAAARVAETPTAAPRATPHRPRGTRRESVGSSPATRRRRPSSN
jgi:hypothetical protein